METINQGTDELNEMDALSCCFPPGTESIQAAQP